MSLTKMSSSHSINNCRELFRFVTSAPTECPYGRDALAVYKYTYAHSLPHEAMGHFLETGHRRNGNCIYTMACPDCSACVPIRIQPDTFRPNRNQRRILRKNEDLVVSVSLLDSTQEKRLLCNSFLKARYPDQHDSATDYYAGFFANNFCHTVEFQYKIKDRLIGVAIVDADPTWLNAVYFFFDPNEEKRSPGILNILNLMSFCRSNAINNLFLGYWIKGLTSMSYKANFAPHQLYLNGTWTQQKKCRCNSSEQDASGQISIPVS